MRIGIVLTSEFHEELKKNEVISVKSKHRAWLRDVDDRYVLKKGNKRYVTGDVALGCYLQYTYGAQGIQIDMIFPKEVTLRRLHSNVLNFFIIFDRLECFHTQTSEFYRKFVNVMKQAKNIYPNYSFQDLINYKSKYYTYLSKRDIAVIPYLHMKRSEWQKSKTENARLVLIRNFIAKAQQKGWKGIVLKPELGSESIDVEFFTLDTPPERIYSYLEKHLRMYEGIIMQQFVPGFNKNSPEYRTYFIGDEYKYTIITRFGPDKVLYPKDEGGTVETENMYKARTLAKKTLKVLPNIVVQGVELPRLLTRVDVGCCYSKQTPVWINEVEFVPSLYIKESPYFVEALLGDQMVKITKIFMKKKGL